MTDFFVAPEISGHWSLCPSIPGELNRMWNEISVLKHGERRLVQNKYFLSSQHSCNAVSTIYSGQHALAEDYFDRVSIIHMHDDDSQDALWAMSAGIGVSPDIKSFPLFPRHDKHPRMNLFRELAFARPLGMHVVDLPWSICCLTGSNFLAIICELL